MTHPSRGFAALSLSLLVAGVLALVGGSLATWRAWELASPLPSEADFAELGTLIGPDDGEPFARADPVRHDIADTGTVVRLAGDPGMVDAIHERLESGGWRTKETADTDPGVRALVATKDSLRVYVIADPMMAATIDVKVIRAATWPVVLGGLLGAAAGAVLGWALVGWGVRRTRRRPVRRAILVVLTVTAVVLLVPGIAHTLYRMLPEGVVIGHNYVEEPFWRGLTGEPRALPALAPAGLALLVLLLPGLPQRRPRARDAAVAAVPSSSS